MARQRPPWNTTGVYNPQDNSYGGGLITTSGSTFQGGVRDWLPGEDRHKKTKKGRANYWGSVEDFYTGQQQAQSYVDTYNQQQAAYAQSLGQPAQPAPQQAVYDPATTAQENPWQLPGANVNATTGQQTAATTPTAAATQPPVTPDGMWANGPLPTATVGPTSSNHPFFDPASDYNVEGRPNSSFPKDSPAYYNWAEENPEGYYFMLLNEQGLGGLDAKSQAAQAMYRDYATGYQAAKQRNQGLRLVDFMAMQNIPYQVAMLSNEQLGLNNESYTGRDRWALRGY